MCGDEHRCPLCGEFTIEESGRYEICPVCFWEDDPYQRNHPDYAGGANELSLNDYKKQFLLP